jgi:tyrosine-protein kinase Etk/Wzc
LEPQQPLSLGALESGYLEAKKQLLLLQARKAAVSKIVASPARVLVALDEEIAHQETLLSIFREQSEQQLKNRQQTLELQIRGLENQIAEWNSKALEASEKLAGFHALNQHDRRLQGMVDQLQATLHSLDVDKGIRQESVAILQPASPARMSPPLLVRQLIMAGLIGAALGLMILFMIDYFDDRPSSFAELEALFPEPVLGQIQLVAAKDRKSKVHILEKDDNRHALVEAYSNLRSALIFKDSPHDHPKRIVVSSAIPGEGKSMVCASLAVTFAQAGARVLLVDADLRRGVLHEHFSVPSSPGFAEVLAEQCSWSKSIAQTGVPNLDFIACGARPQRPSGLLLKNTERFLDEVANHYDYCFFDTAPVMAADDVSSLAPHVDGLLMVIRAGCTSGRIAKAALDALHLRRVNVIGLVFNAVKPGTSDYYYYGHKEYFPTKACA